MRAVGAVVLSALVVGALGTAAPRPLPVDRPEQAAATVDIKVSVRTDKGCKGAGADSLPALVSATGLGPGEVTPTVVVCLRNQGGGRATASMTVIELVGRDEACSGDESQVDSTCGSGLVGELQDALVQEFILLDKCGDPATTEFASVPFDGLAAEPMRIGPIGRNDIRCVAIRLRQTNDARGVAAQSDSISWRYAFQLTA